MIFYYFLLVFKTLRISIENQPFLFDIFEENLISLDFLFHVKIYTTVTAVHFLQVSVRKDDLVKTWRLYSGDRTDPDRSGHKWAMVPWSEHFAEYQNMKTLQWGPDRFGLKYARVIWSKHFCGIKWSDFPVRSTQIWNEIWQPGFTARKSWSDHRSTLCGTMTNLSKIFQNL